MHALIESRDFIAYLTRYVLVHAMIKTRSAKIGYGRKNQLTIISTSNFRPTIPRVCTLLFQRMATESAVCPPVRSNLLHMVKAKMCAEERDCDVPEASHVSSVFQDWYFIKCKEVWMWHVIRQGWNLILDRFDIVYSGRGMPFRSRYIITMPGEGKGEVWG